jgi:DNA adenine methylase
MFDGMATTKPKRPVLRYHGGKWLLGPWIIQHFPDHKTYAEPFCGSASVLFMKDRSWTEVINDLDGEIINLFRVLRERGPELAEQLELTPYAIHEFRHSYEPSEDELEQARRTVVRAFMGFASASSSGQRTGFRGRNGFDGGNAPPNHWRRYPAGIPEYVERLRGVVIENRDSSSLFDLYDHERTLFYCDPPYVVSTRSGRSRTSPSYKY